LENTIKIVRAVEKTHKNLGLPVVFAKLIDFSNMGLFLCGARSMGKGAILNCIKQLRHRDVMEITRITPAGLAKEADSMSHRTLTVINPDFSSFYTDYLKDAGVNLISHLLTEHSVPKSWTAQYRYDIEECYISFLSGVQPVLIRQINKLPQWESMYRDRFMRFHLLYPLGTPKYVAKYPETPVLVFDKLNPEKDITLPDSIKETEEYRRLKTVFWRQTSEGRSGLFLDRMLKSHAFLNNRDCVAEKDVKFLCLFIPYLQIDYLLSERDSVSSPLLFNPDAYLVLNYVVEHVEATRQQLKDYFLLVKEKGKMSALTRALDPLRAANLIEGVYGTNIYRINGDWYKRYIKPIIDWSDEIGIKHT
jgi:hypothetical protein